MVAILYRWRVHEGKLAGFTEAWATVTDELKKSRPGCLRSVLFRTDDGEQVVATAYWQSREHWEALDETSEIAAHGLARTAATAELMSTEVLELVSDRYGLSH